MTKATFRMPLLDIQPEWIASLPNSEFRDTTLFKYVKACFAEAPSVTMLDDMEAATSVIVYPESITGYKVLYANTRKAPIKGLRKAIRNEVQQSNINEVAMHSISLYTFGTQSSIMIRCHLSVK